MKRRKQIWVRIGILFFGFSLFCGLYIGQSACTLSNACNETLFVVRGGEVFCYDEKSLQMLPVQGGVYDLCDAGDGNIWLLLAAGDAADLLLWDGENVVQTVPLDFRPLALRALRDGLLLVRQHPWERMTVYLRRNLPMYAVTADIVYLNTVTLQQSFLTTCGFPKVSWDGSFFAVYGETFTFLKPELLVQDTVCCDTSRVCVYTADGTVREVSLQQEAKIHDIYPSPDGLVAVGNGGLYTFSAENGLGEMLLRRKDLSAGAFSADGKYYLYPRIHGLFGDRESLYGARLSDGCTVRLRGTKQVYTTSGFEDVCFIQF